MWLFGWLSLAALISYRTACCIFETLIRAGGLFAQADILACVIGVSIILGQNLLEGAVKFKRVFAANQILLTILLGLTVPGVGYSGWDIFPSASISLPCNDREFSGILVDSNLLSTMVMFMPSRYTDTRRR